MNVLWTFLMIAVCPKKLDESTLKEIFPALPFHDDYEFPANTSPLQITKLTCGSLITFYDSHRPDATVAVDVCLSALILAKVL